MKGISISTIYIIAACVFLNLTLGVQAQKNLLQTTDFEEGFTAPWTMWVEGAGAGVTAKMSIDDKESLDGKSSLVIETEKDGNGQRIELHQNPFVLDNGTELTFAMWMKAEEVRPAKLIVNHRAAPWTSYGSKEVTIQEEWEEFWVDVKMTANDDIVGVYIELRDTLESSVWFDEGRFYEGEYEPVPGLGRDLAVDAKAKLATMWGRLKSQSN